jgi:hypothetical protein
MPLPYLGCYYKIIFLSFGIYMFNMCTVPLRQFARIYFETTNHTALSTDLPMKQLRLSLFISPTTHPLTYLHVSTYLFTHLRI